MRAPFTRAKLPLGSKLASSGRSHRRLEISRALAHHADADRFLAQHSLLATVACAACASEREGTFSVVALSPIPFAEEYRGGGLTSVIAGAPFSSQKMKQSFPVSALFAYFANSISACVLSVECKTKQFSEVTHQMNFSNQNGVRAAFAPGRAFSLKVSIFINAFFSASETTLSWCLAVLSSFVSCFFFRSKRALQFANADKLKSSGMSIGLCFFTTTSSPVVSSISTSSFGASFIVTWLFFKSKLEMNFATGLPLLFSS